MIGPEEAMPFMPHSGSDGILTQGEFASLLHGGFPGEPSLFEEMGIHSTNVKENLKVILLPFSEVHGIDDNFLIGLLFFFAFAGSLIPAGKVRFSMVYFIGLVGLMLLKLLFDFMHDKMVTAGQLFTALSYCTIPLIPAVLICAVFRPRAAVIAAVGFPWITWAAFSAMRYIVHDRDAAHIRSLVFVPVWLFYGLLLLLPIF